MARAPFNILVIPYRRRGTAHQFALFHRSDSEMWQFIAGGGEGAETALEAAQRETFEEAGIGREHDLLALDSRASIPRDAFPGAEWTDSGFVIPEFCFALNADGVELRLSHEHDRVEWLDYESAYCRLTWDSNRVALWELQQRLGR